MDPTILYRLVPAVLVAVAVLRLEGRRRGITTGRAVDEALRAVVVGGVAARIAWLLLGGPLVWRRLASTAVLVRAGVETWVGAAVAGWWALRNRPHERAWLIAAGPPAALAGVATWSALCGVEAVCGGVPAAWGLPVGPTDVPVVPVSHLEALVTAGLAAAAWRLRDRPAASAAIGACYALVRGALGYLRPAVLGHPTRDQLWSAAAAVVLGGLAVRLARRRSRPSDRPDTVAPRRRG